MDSVPIDGLPLHRDPVDDLDGCPLGWDPLDGVPVDDLDGVPLAVAMDDIDGMPRESVCTSKEGGWGETTTTFNQALVSRVDNAINPASQLSFTPPRSHSGGEQRSSLHSAFVQVGEDG